MPSPKPLIVIMGVSGSGKTTIGKLLADEIDVPFRDADELHPASNVAKMAAGHPLTDDDRWPWLARVGSTLAESETTGLVMACSALKRSYREAILREESTALFAFLSGSPELLRDRLAHRTDHFMPSSLLDSQLETLEPLADDEHGATFVLNQGDSPEDLAVEIAAALVP